MYIVLLTIFGEYFGIKNCATLPAIKNCTYVCMSGSSDAPTGRFGRTVGSVSDKQWVRLVLAKNYRTPNSSVALFFNIFTCFTQNFNVKIEILVIDNIQNS